MPSCFDSPNVYKVMASLLKAKEPSVGMLPVTSTLTYPRLLAVWLAFPLAAMKSGTFELSVFELG